MATTRQAATRKLWPANTAPTPGQPSLTAADSTHQEVPSPAMLLQDRVGAALAAANGAHGFEPVIEKWSPTIRLAVLFAGAAASWLLVWQAVTYLI